MRRAHQSWIALYLLAGAALAAASLCAGVTVSRVAAQAEEGAAPGADHEDAAQSRSAAFQAVSGSPTQDVPGGPLLVYAYAFVLAAVVVYVARLGLLQSKNRAELERLGRVLERARKD